MPRAPTHQKVLSASFPLLQLGQVAQWPQLPDRRNRNHQPYLTEITINSGLWRNT